MAIDEKAWLIAKQKTRCPLRHEADVREIIEAYEAAKAHQPDMTPKDVADYVAGTMALEGQGLTEEQRKELEKKAAHQPDEILDNEYPPEFIEWHEKHQTSFSGGRWQMRQAWEDARNSKPISIERCWDEARKYEYCGGGCETDLMDVVKAVLDAAGVAYE